MFRPVHGHRHGNRSCATHLYAYSTVMFCKLLWLTAAVGSALCKNFGRSFINCTKCSVITLNFAGFEAMTAMLLTIRFFLDETICLYLCQAVHLEDDKTIFRNVGLPIQRHSVAFKKTCVFTFNICLSWPRLNPWMWQDRGWQDRGWQVAVHTFCEFENVRRVLLMNCLMLPSFECDCVLMQLVCQLVLHLTRKIMFMC